MFLSSRKGISEIVAALLVVCITVSAGTLLAAYASGLMGSIQNPITTQPYTEALTLEYYTWLDCPSGSTCSGSSQSPTLTIRNDGAATVTLVDFFMQGVRNTTSLTAFGSNCPSPNRYVLPVQQSCTFTFPIPTTLTVNSGIAYTVKFVASDGTTFTFSCVAGSNTH